MKRIPCRLFTEEFKREAIKLDTEQQLNPASAVRQLEVDPKSMRAWIAQAESETLKKSRRTLRNLRSKVRDDR